MRTLLKNAMVYTANGFEKKNIIISKGEVFVSDISSFDNSIDYSGKYIIPGFVDVHVHLREPGFFYKETIKSGTMAAAAGGFTAVCSMPNLKPAPTNLENLKVQLDIIEKDAVIKVYPYGAITSDQSGIGDLSKMEEMAPFVVAFTDDGKGVQEEETMRQAMIKASKLNKIIVAHCEDESLNETPYMGTTSISEYSQVIRDINLSKETGCGYHVCHASAKESIEAVRQGKQEGVNVTCETGPHYVVFNKDTIKAEGRFKMNPPIKEEEDRIAIIEAIKDGTLDMIATDHAPHSREEKAKGFVDSMFGVVGLETSFGILNKHLVKSGIISLEKLIDIMAIKPRERFGLEGGYIKDGQVADLTVLDIDVETIVNPNEFLSMGKSTPFEDMQMAGKIIATYVNGEIKYENIK
ncbi:MAG: dihydroorotase [Anaerovoracaceae bacterium]